MKKLGLVLVSVMVVAGLIAATTVLTNAGKKPSTKVEQQVDNDAVAPVTDVATEAATYATSISVLGNAAAGSTVTLSGSYSGTTTMKKNSVTVKASGATLTGGYIIVTGSSNSITGLKIVSASDTALFVRSGAQNNKITSVTVSKAQDFGFGTRDSGTKNNTFASCRSEYNYDSAGSGGNADGFGVKFSCNQQTFTNCVAYNNSDDGWDGWNSGSGTNVLTSCTAEKNGYKSDGSTNSSMNGCGFKCGGTSATSSWKFTSCVAKNNKTYGWKRNHTTGSISRSGCTSTGNGKADALGSSD